MQPLNATARPRCGSIIGCAPRSERSMMLSRRWPRPVPLCAHRPAPSGPRGAIDSDIRASAAASAGRPSCRSSPAMPHTAYHHATRPDRPSVGAGSDRRAICSAGRTRKGRNMRRFDLVPGYAPPRVRLDPPPLIGVSTSEMRIPARTRSLAESEPPMRELALGLAYPRSVERAGALPVVLPPMDLDDIEKLLDRLDGVMISGGPDLHPSAYGEEEHPALGPTERDLDAFELTLVRAADARGMPILGICRGEQVLNVARGGTLFQDLPSAV